MKTLFHAVQRTAFSRRLWLLPLVGFLGAVAWAQTRPGEEKPKMVPVLTGYTNWQLVNADPTEMEPRVAVMCAPAGGFGVDLAPTSVMGNGGPHDKKWINVFINSQGEDAMMNRKFPQFPEGTVIVKQKLGIPVAKGKSTKTPKPTPGQQPELLTVMIKREAGYNPKNGDWEWMVTDGAGEKVAGSGQLEACQNCHQPYSKTDFVVRSYLPAEIMEALKDNDTSAGAESK